MDATPTTMVRFPRDLAEMLSGLWFHERINIAEFLDPIVRDAITARYNAMPPEVRAAMESRRKRRAAEPAAPSPA